MKSSDVVQAAVIRLADDGVDGSDLFVAGLRQCVRDDTFDAGADTQRVGQHDRRFDLTELEHLCGSGQLAERVADEHRAGHLLLEQVAAVRQDCRDAGPDVVAFDDRRVPDLHAFDIGDRVERSRWKDARGEADFARARPLLSAHERGDRRDHGDQTDDSRHRPES